MASQTIMENSRAISYLFSFPVSFINLLCVLAGERWNEDNEINEDGMIGL